MVPIVGSNISLDVAAEVESLDVINIYLFLMFFFFYFLRESKSKSGRGAEREGGAENLNRALR